MKTDQQFDHLVRFFKVLSEPNRLKIVGLLAQSSRTGEQLGVLLKLGASTVSHHLSRLSEAGLVAARAESYYNIYSLKTDELMSMARNMLTQTEQPRSHPESDLDAFDRKVLATFLLPDGRIKAFPTQEKKCLVLVRHVLKDFAPGVRYSEKRVNQMLAEYHVDTARLRRALVDYRFMAREGGGGKYWRIDDEAVRNIDNG